MSMVWEWVGAVMTISSIFPLGRTRNVPLGLPISMPLDSSLLSNKQQKGKQTNKQAKESSSHSRELWVHPGVLVIVR